MSESPKGPNKLAGAVAGTAALATTLTGLGGAADATPPPPSQRPPAAVAQVQLAPGGGILQSTPAQASKPQEQSPKQEITVTLPGTKVAVGIERDNNGTLNTGEDGPEPGVPARELIPDIMPNLVAGTSDNNRGTVGDGWHLQLPREDMTAPIPKIVESGPTLTEETHEAIDINKYPIQTPWEQDYQASPELAKEVKGAVQECFDGIQARRKLGYNLTGVQIGGLASDEGNAENPGDPMANLGQHSKLNHDLANQRGIAGLQTALELAPENNIPPELIKFMEGQEVLASDQEIKEIAGYAELLGQDPLELIQDYNRAKTEGLQPLMDELFKGNRGIICIAEYTKTETSIVQGPSSQRVVLVPVTIEGRNLEWRIEIPGELALLPLLYIAIKTGMGALGAGGGATLLGGTRLQTNPVRPSNPPAGAGPNPSELKTPIKPTRRTTPNPANPNQPEPGFLPPEQPPSWQDIYPTKPPKELGSVQAGHQQAFQRIKQPRPANFHGAGLKSSGKPMGRSRGGNRSGKRTGSGR